MRGAAIDEVDPDDVDRLHDGIVWYAEEVGSGDRVRVSVILEVSGEERLTDTSMRSNQPVTTLKPILGQFFPPTGQ